MNNTKIFNKDEMPFIKQYQRIDFVGIPKITNIVENDIAIEVTFEYIEGNQIDEFYEIKQPVKELYNDFLRLCSIVDVLHKHGIIHRDIKPQNIIKTYDGRIYLIDFGISRLHKEDKNKDTTLFGTEYYAAPEQYGFSQTDARTCIYQIGKTFSTLCENYNISKHFEAQIDKCIAFDPKDRYQTISEIMKHKSIKEEHKSKVISPTNIFIIIGLGVFTFGGILCAFDPTVTPNIGASLGYILMVLSADLLYYYYEFGSKHTYKTAHKVIGVCGFWFLFCFALLVIYDLLKQILFTLF